MTGVASTIGNGSPPRLWGKRRILTVAPYKARFTPTPVGKTSPAEVYSQKMTVHPHACGENDFTFVFTDENGWFTPTPVGKTVSCAV